MLYVFVIDPAAKGADYTVSTILAEAFPADVQTIFKAYSESYASGQNFVNLTLVNEPSYAHNDPAGAYPHNIFFSHLLPFLRTVAAH